ncbi:hypothetical protein D3H35_09925 [Cohnella faecalis]|uniref:Uncharacterized protein n=1 Tax=Cohnella faecalis TaxID=2315694 RepID=A0A398CSX4_9BACL|nr:hypothetical protein D3H35_09925 [Cohnella faecalis]
MHISWSDAFSDEIGRSSSDEFARKDGFINETELRCQDADRAALTPFERKIIPTNYRSALLEAIQRKVP